jgi:hypothetical protein
VFSVDTGRIPTHIDESFSDIRHNVWACGSVEEGTALYGSAYTSVGGTIDPPDGGGGGCSYRDAARDFGGDRLEASNDS